MSVSVFIQRLLQRPKRPRTVYTIFHNANAMKLSWVDRNDDRGAYVVSWQDVIRVQAFKRDLYAVDLICTELILRDDRALEINEEMDGWDSLVQKLPEYLPGCKKFHEWFMDVAIPAFETNETTLYQRDE